MRKKSNNVQHFKLKPSQSFRYFQLLLYGIALGLVLFCSLDVVFKVLLFLLIVLEYFRQQLIKRNKNHIEAIEIRDDKLFIKRKRDSKLQSISQLSIKQNRIFAELELHLKDEVRSEFIFHDCFYAKSQFSLLMQQLRFIHL